MPIALRHCPKLDLNLVEYSGSVTLTELEALAVFNGKDPQHLRRDCLSWVPAGVDFRSVEMNALDAMFGRYRTLYAPLNFQIFRRSAWVCQSEAARTHVDYWIGGREIRELMSSATRQFDNFVEAGDWLLLSETELADVERGVGFEDIAYFADAPQRAAAR